jgi:histidinol-phosphate aminotransferase
MNIRSKSSVAGIRGSINDVNPYQPGKFIEEIQDQFGLDEVIKIASNENPYGPYPHSMERMKKEVEMLNRYPDSNFKALRETIGHLHGISSDCISISHGAESMLQTIAKCFIEKNDEVIIPGATYTLYREISKVMGAKVMTVPMENETVSLSAIEKHVGNQTKLIWLANPNNPTGTIVAPKEIDSLLQRLPGHTWLILDEAYAEFADAQQLPDRVSLIRNGRSIISVRTFSKAYGLAGARIGYAIASPEVTTVINTVSEPFNANRVAIAGALAAINEDGDHFIKAIDQIKQDRTRSEQRLSRMGLRVIPSQANFIMFETPIPAEKIFDDLLTFSIIVRPCNAWGFDHMVRVSIGTTRQMDRFIQALSQVLQSNGIKNAGQRTG